MTILSTVNDIFTLYSDRNDPKYNNSEAVVNVNYRRLESLLPDGKSALLDLKSEDSDKDFVDLVNKVSLQKYLVGSVIPFIDAKGRKGLAMEYKGKTLIFKYKAEGLVKVYCPTGVTFPAFPREQKYWDTMFDIVSERVVTPLPVIPVPVTK